MANLKKIAAFGAVLILVLMEDGLRARKQIQQDRCMCIVLILVLMEDGLRDTVYSMTPYRYRVVLILVLMEDGLRVLGTFLAGGALGVS